MNQPASLPRVKTLGCLWSDKRLLVEECRGPHSSGEGIYYRPLGGTVEFGERSDDALKREFFEEIGEQVKVVSYIGCLENIFTVQSEMGHEVIQLYDVQFVEESNYLRDRFRVHEGEKQAWAKWIAFSEFIDGKAILYPEKLTSLLERGARWNKNK